MNQKPLKIIHNIINEHYPDAKAVFWGGSAAHHEETEGSDLDLVIILESLDKAYHETFIYEEWPVDVFVHNPDTLLAYFKDTESENYVIELIYKIIDGYEILKTNQLAKKIIANAKYYAKLGPCKWPQSQIDKQRFLLTDIWYDIKFPKNKQEQVASAIHLFESLIQFYFRAQQKWPACGKSLLRLLTKDNPKLALEFSKSVERFFQKNDISGIEKLVLEVLSPYGGLLWEGYCSK